MPGSSRAAGNVSLIVGEPYCLPGELLEGIVGSEILGKDGAILENVFKCDHRAH